MKTNKIILGGMVAGFVMMGAFALSLALKYSGADGGRLGGGDTKPVTTESKEPNLVLGAIPGNQIPFDYFEINGVGHYFYEQKMTSAGTNGGTATGTVCAFKLPTASTTLVNYNASIYKNAPTSTSQLAVYHIPPAVVGWATSSVKAIGGIQSTIAQGGRLVSTSTQATSTAATGMFLQGSSSGDNESWLLFDLMQGSSPFTGEGTCRVELREL